MSPDGKVLAQFIDTRNTRHVTNVLSAFWGVRYRSIVGNSVIGENRAFGNLMHTTCVVSSRVKDRPDPAGQPKPFKQCYLIPNACKARRLEQTLLCDNRTFLQ